MIRKKKFSKNNVHDVYMISTNDANLIRVEHIIDLNVIIQQRFWMSCIINVYMLKKLCKKKKKKNSMKEEERNKTVGTVILLNSSGDKSSANIIHSYHR